MSITPWGRVPADHVAVVERIGRVERVVPAGERVMCRPVIERVSCLLSTLTHRLALRDEPLVGADHFVVLVDAQVDYRIVDAMTTSTSVLDYQGAVSTLAIHILRDIAADRDSEVMLVSGGAMAASLQTTLSERVTAWGLEVTRTDVSVARHRADASRMSSTELLGY